MPAASPATLGGSDSAQRSADPWIGQKLDGRYTLEELIGEGGTGQVYRARQEATGREVAVKLLRESLIHDEASVRRFKREARAACRINHPNAITVHDFGSTPDGHCYLVTELIDGETLRAVLAREAPLFPARALLLFQQIVAGVAAAHEKGVVHRELHPGNIFLCRDNSGEEHIKVFDFGGARLIDGSLDTEVTGVGQLDLRQLLHSIRYLPPERLQRDLRPDPRGDVYGLGLILFELCTGAHPFDANDPLEVMAKHLHEPPPLLSIWAPERWFSPALQGLVTSMLAKDPGQRPADAFEVADRLAIAQERDALITDNTSVPEPVVEIEMVALPADEEGAMLGAPSREATFALPVPIPVPIMDSAQRSTAPFIDARRSPFSPAHAGLKGPPLLPAIDDGSHEVRRLPVLISIGEEQDEAISRMPTLADYDPPDGVAAAGRLGTTGKGVQEFPFQTMIDLRTGETARVTAVAPEPASQAEFKLPTATRRPGRYSHWLVAAICVLLGAAGVFATATLVYHLRQGQPGFELGR